MKLLAHRRRSLIVLLLLSSMLFAAPRPGHAQSTDLPTDGLMLWLDASDPDADGNPNNNPADGATLSSWKDKSGNGNHADPFGSHVGGAFKQDQANGKPVVRFDATADPKQAYDTTFSLKAAETPDTTILTVYRITPHDRDMLGLWGNYERAFYPVDNDSTTGFVGVGTSEATADTGTVGSFRLFVASYDGNVVGGVNSGPVDGSAAYLDGEQLFTFTDSTADSVANNSFAIGVDGPESDIYFNGDIAEVIVYDRVLSDDELQRIFWTLGQKYAEDWGGTPPPPEPTPEPTGPQCFTDVDMAVSPQFISLAPGGEATVNVAVRNTNDELQGYNDILVSFSDGLDVVSVSGGGVDLGQRAAWQKFQLEANETREFAVTVRAAERLVATPVHITELYCGGRVLERIDGVFIAPAPTAAPAVVAPAPAPAPTAVPAPLPAVLPNTAGDQRSGDWSAAGLAVVIVLGAWLLRRRRRA